MNRRIASHLDRPTRPKIKTSSIKTWMYDLVQDGKLPVFQILEYTETREQVLERETWWIGQMSRQGAELLNRTRKHREIIKRNLENQRRK